MSHRRKRPTRSQVKAWAEQYVNGELTALQAGRQRKGETQIEQDVRGAFPLITSWLLSWIIKWILRQLFFDPAAE